MVCLQVPSSTLGTDLSSLLETGENADVTFTVRITSAHLHVNLPCSPCVLQFQPVNCPCDAARMLLKPPDTQGSAAPLKCAARMHTSLHTSSSRMGKSALHFASSLSGPDPSSLNTP